MDDMRREFEALLKLKGISAESKLNNWTEKLEYIHPHVESMWIGWQARHTSLVVKLPESCCGGCDSGDRYFKEGYDEALSDCRATLEAQGLKVE